MTSPGDFDGCLALEDIFSLPHELVDQAMVQASSNVFLSMKFL